MPENKAHLYGNYDILCRKNITSAIAADMGMGSGFSAKENRMIKAVGQAQ